MKTVKLRDFFLVKSDNLAFVIVVGAAMFNVVLTLWRQVSGEFMAFLLLLALIYLVVGLFGTEYCEKAGSPWITLGYFVVQIGLGGAILYLSKGSAWLLLMPIASIATVLLPRWAVPLVVGLLMSMLILTGYSLTGQWEVITASTIAFLAALVFVISFTQITVNEQKTRSQIERLASELQEANRKLREYAAQVEELAITQERNRLAREIHDGLGHYLTSINMQLKAAQAVWEQDPERAAGPLGKAQSLTQEALSDVRRSVGALRSGPVLGPLPQAVESQLADLCTSGIKAQFELRGEPRPLSPQAELAFYRTAQEGLTNVCKHAQATQVEMVLEYQANAVRLEIRDNGIGSNETSQGFGLFGLQERVQLLGGKVTFATSPGLGFHLDVEIPG